MNPKRGDYDEMLVKSVYEQMRVANKPVKLPLGKRALTDGAGDVYVRFFQRTALA
ncbi:MAG: hypothetical protein AAGA53_17270 [Pseudomonadota bacterium]